jgi:hypothetical protein
LQILSHFVFLHLIMFHTYAKQQANYRNHNIMYVSLDFVQIISYILKIIISKWHETRM